MKKKKTKSTLDSYCKKLLQKRNGTPFRTECFWSLVKYGDAKNVEGYFEEWGNLDKFEKENLRYEGFIEWDDKNYEQATLEEVADNSHLEFVLKRALKSNNFWFLGRLDIHSDIILDYLKADTGKKLFDFEEGFSKEAVKFLVARERGFPIPLENLCLLNPYWPERTNSSKIELSRTDYLSDRNTFWETMRADYKVILLRGAKSVGKTTAIKHYLEKEVSKNNPVLVLTHRTALAANLAEKLSLNNYVNVPDFESPDATRMALCVNSLIKLRHRIRKGDYDGAIVFIDEVMSFLPYIAYGGEEIGMPEKRTCIVTSLKLLFERASKVILADADLAEFVYEFCNDIFGGEKVCVLNITKQVPYTKKVKLFKHKGGALEHVATELIKDSNNLPLIIFSGSKEDTNQIKRFYESTYPYPYGELSDLGKLPNKFHPKVLKVNSGSSDFPMSRKFFENPSQYIKDSKLKLLIATNSIDAGVSIDVRDYFKSVLLGTDSNHISPLVMSQQAFRLRDVKVERIFLVPQRVIIKNIDTREKRKLTIQANRLYLVERWVENPHELALLKKSLQNRKNSQRLKTYFGIDNVKKILEIKNFLLDLELDCLTPYLDLMCAVVNFDRKLKNNFVDALTESLLIDGNTIETEEITTPGREKAKRELPGTIEEIMARTQTATPEDDIDYFIISVNDAFGKNAHKIEGLLIAYENQREKKLKCYVDRAKVIFFKSKETFMIENRYALDAHEDYEKLLVLFDWELNKYGEEIVNGYLSYQSLKQLLEASKPIKDKLLKSFTTRQKTLDRVPQVLSLITKALGLDFESKKDNKYPLKHNLEAHLILKLWQDM